MHDVVHLLGGGRYPPYRGGGGQPSIPIVIVTFRADSRIRIGRPQAENLENLEVSTPKFSPFFSTMTRARLVISK